MAGGGGGGGGGGRRGGAGRGGEREPAPAARPAHGAPPPYYPAREITRQGWARYLNSVSGMDRRVGGVLEQLREDEVHFVVVGVCVKRAQRRVDGVLGAKRAGVTGVLCEDQIGFAKNAQCPQSDVLQTSDRRRDYGQAT